MMNNDLAIVLYVLFLTEAARGIVLPTLALGILSAGGSLASVGSAVALFSLGRLVATLPLAYLAEWQSTRMSVLVACVLSMSGHVVYAAFAGVPKLEWAVLTSRFVIGLGTGTVGVCRGYVARSPMSDRTRRMALAGLAQFAGFALSPAVALAFSDYTTPAVCMVVLNFAAVGGVVIFLPRKDPECENDTTEEALPTVDARRLEAHGFVVFMLLNVVLRGVLADAEALVPAAHDVIFDDVDKDAISDSAEFFVLLGVFGCACFLLIDPFVRKVHCMNEVMLFCSGIFLICLGCLFLIDQVHGANFGIFTLGAVLIWCLGSPLVQTFTIALFSKLLGSKPQAVSLSWITTAGSIGRIIFPLLGVRMPSAAMWGVNMVLCVLCICAIAWFYRRVARERLARVHTLLGDRVVETMEMEDPHVEMVERS